MFTQNKFNETDIRLAINNLIPAYSQKVTVKGGIKVPYYHSNEHVIVFPLVSNNADESDLDNIDTILSCASVPLLAARDSNEFAKPWIFIVHDERNILISDNIHHIPRDHWLVLHYSPVSGEATIIDPSSNFNYSYESIYADLKRALFHLHPFQHAKKQDLKVFQRARSFQDYDLYEQSVQFLKLNRFSSALCVVDIVKSLVEGKSIENYVERIGALEEDIITYEMNELQNSCSLLQAEQMPHKDLDSGIELINMSTELRNMSTGPFSNQFIDQLLQEVINNFKSNMSSEYRIAFCILDRKGIKFEQHAITKKYIDDSSLKLILDRLEQNYSGPGQVIHNTQLDSRSPQDDNGVTVAEPLRYVGLFLNMGFSNEEIDSIPLRDLIKYASAIFTAQVDSTFDFIFKREKMVFQLTAGITPDFESKRPVFEKKLNQLLKAEVQRLEHERLNSLDAGNDINYSMN